MQKTPTALADARHDLRDLTFIVPVYLDSPTRLENLRWNLQHLNALFQTRILIGEQKLAASTPLPELLPEFQFEYFAWDADEGQNPIHRTRVLNRLLAQVSTPFVCNLDCDFVAPPRQYLMAMQLLRWRVAEFVLPHRGRTLHIEDDEKAQMLAILKKRAPDESEIARLVENVVVFEALGGAVFCDTEIYRRHGGENENFLGWGWEDFERRARFQKLGFRWLHVAGDGYHLNHPRAQTGAPDHDHYGENHREFERINAMTREELRDEIESWKWER